MAAVANSIIWSEVEVCRSWSLWKFSSVQHSAEGNNRSGRIGSVVVKAVSRPCFLLDLAFNISGMGFPSHGDELFSTPEDSKDTRVCARPRGAQPTRRKGVKYNVIVRRPFVYIPTRRRCVQVRVDKRETTAVCDIEMLSSGTSIEPVLFYSSTTLTQASLCTTDARNAPS